MKIILALLIVCIIVLFVLLILAYKKIDKILDEKTSIAWKLIRLEREYNLIKNSIITIEDELPVKISTASIGMKLSNEMIHYVDIDYENNKLKARMIVPNYCIDDYEIDHQEDKKETNKSEKE